MQALSDIHGTFVDIRTNRTQQRLLQLLEGLIINQVLFCGIKSMHELRGDFIILCFFHFFVNWLFFDDQTHVVVVIFLAGLILFRNGFGIAHLSRITPLFFNLELYSIQKHLLRLLDLHLELRI